MSKFRRELKNVVYNYSDAEAKVREATSNDPWGPSSALMGELAEYTYHVQAYGLVMGMLWKRLNDHGKNWRHVYKSLVVLEYLIKTGSERVSQQCKDNLFSIQTLKDFQYIDKDGKDQGANIREKAKQLVSLLKDDERLKDERRRGQQARARHSAISSNAADTPPANKKKVQFSGSDTDSPSREGSATGRFEQDVEQARPTDTSEEEMQLKLALQLSKQQADEEERLKNQEEESLRAAIALSKQDTSQGDEEEGEGSDEPPTTNGGPDLLLDFGSTGLADPWGASNKEETEALPSYDDITSGAIGDPWAGSTMTSVPQPQVPAQPTQPVPLVDPWGFSPSTGTAATVPPAGSAFPTQPQPNPDPWGLNSSSGPAQPDPFDLSSLNLPPIDPSTTVQPVKSDRVEDQFLGDLGQLVNLDLLSGPPPPKMGGGPSPANPFGTASSNPQQALNPFEANKAPAPTLNQIAASKQPPYGGPNLPPPLVPTSGGSQGSSPVLPRHQQPSPNQSYNPFS